MTVVTQLSRLKVLVAPCTVALCALITAELFRPTLLLVGPVTIDEVDGTHSLGGAVSYAAAVASAYGVSACVLTAASSDTNLSLFKGHQLHVTPSGQTLTFKHTYTWWGNKRKLQVTAQPNVTLGVHHVPWRCRRARTVLLGPLTAHDVDIASFVRYQQGFWDQALGFTQEIGLLAQGLQRAVDDSSGKVSALRAPSQQLLDPTPSLNPEAQDALGPHTSVFLSDVETDAWRTGTVSELVGRTQQLVITRGELGAIEYVAGSAVHLPPNKVVAVDTNGAGDTFATAYMLAVADWEPHPGSFATWAASRAVMQPQECKPACIAAAITADDMWARWGSGLRPLRASLRAIFERARVRRILAWLRHLGGQARAASPLAWALRLWDRAGSDGPGEPVRWHALTQPWHMGTRWARMLQGVWHIPETVEA